MSRLLNDNLIKRPGLWVVIALGLIVVAAATSYYQTSKPADPAAMQGSQDRNLESAAGKNDGGQSNQNEAGRAQDIQKTAEPAAISPENRRRLRSLIAREPNAHTDGSRLSLTLGAAVPRETTLFDLPDEASDLLQGYTGDKYFVAGDQLVIVDAQARRIVALIPFG